MGQLCGGLVIKVSENCITTVGTHNENFLVIIVGITIREIISPCGTRWVLGTMRTCRGVKQAPSYCTRVLVDGKYNAADFDFCMRKLFDRDFKIATEYYY